MPKLWDDTIEAHRGAVGAAIFAATGAIVAEEGFTGLGMAKIAARAGIGRATLYKYFGDVDALLVAWHRHMIGAHLAALARVRAAHPEPAAALSAIATATAQIRHGHHAPVAALLHSLPHVRHARDHLTRLFGEVIAEAAAAGAVRTDIDAAELARFVVAALDAAPAGKAATARLVELIRRALAPVTPAAAPAKRPPSSPRARRGAAGKSRRGSSGRSAGPAR
jgi:AcrR family transcriptional regulator